MKYKCLVLDHDDTVVNSTATIHYPSFTEYMAKVRPEIHLSLEEYFAYNFSPGVIPLFSDICGLNAEEIAQEEAFWAEYVKTRIPRAYPGIREILVRHKNRGGIICVTSHSFSHNIQRDYRENGLPEPDRIFGWELPSELRKPNPWALYEIMRVFGLQKSDLLVVDDLKPGHDMARSAGIDFAAVGWANDVRSIEDYMKNHSDFYFKTVPELDAFLA